MNFIKRMRTNLKTAQKILKGTIIMCPYCRSLEVTHQEPQISTLGGTTIERYFIECKNCKSSGMVTEHWVKG